MSTLSWSTRIKAFCICFVLGILLSFLGSIALFLHRGIVVFAVFYTIGNLVSMARWVDNRNTFHTCRLIISISTCSTCFLMGPFKQIKKMFAETRLIATSIVIVSIVMTFVSAIVVYYDLNSFRFPSSFHILLFVCSWKRPDWRLYSSSYSPWPWPGTRYPIYPMHAMRYAAPCLPASRFSRTRPSWSIICTLLYIYCSNAYY